MRSILLLATLLVVTAAPAQQAPENPPAATPSENPSATPVGKPSAPAEAEADRAAQLERRGKKEAAIVHHEIAARMAEETIAALDRDAVPQIERPLDVYYRCATSYLHAGRLLAYLKREGSQKDEDLRKAVIYLDQIEKTESDRAQRAGGPINPEVWRVRNAEGYASFLQGELAQARVHYRAVLEINPSYKPAEQAIAEINKLEQEQNEQFTPQGPTLQKEKKRRLLGRILETLKLVKAIVPIPL